MSEEARQRLEQLLASHAGTIRRAIQRSCPRHLDNDLDDIEQEVHVRLWRALESEREILHPTSYLHMAAVNATLDAIRRRRARPEEPLELEGGEDSPVRAVASTPSPELHAQRRQQVSRVEQAFSQLVPNRAQALRLHLQGFTTAEIGELLGWSEAKARNLVYRGLADLRLILEKEGVDGT